MAELGIKTNFLEAQALLDEMMLLVGTKEVSEELQEKLIKLANDDPKEIAKIGEVTFEKNKIEIPVYMSDEFMEALYELRKAPLRS